MLCSYCGQEFERKYAISASRAARPQYCSRECQSERQRERGDELRAELLWAKISKGKQGDCWEWTGYRNESGYGKFGRQLAHRVAFEIHTGVAPGDKFVCHTCDNPPCCNPAHLWLGSPAENAADMDRKGRRRTMSPTKRLKIFQALRGECHICGGSIKPGEAWEIEHLIPIGLGGADDATNFRLAHKGCHKDKTREDVGRIAKAKRIERRHIGVRKKSRMPGSKDSKWKRKLNGQVVAR